MIGATYFSNSFRDLIDYKYSATEPNYFNVARTRTSGWSSRGVCGCRTVFTPTLRTRTWTRASSIRGTSTEATAVFAPGARLLRRPMHTLDVGVGYRAARHGSTCARCASARARINYYRPRFLRARA